MDFNETKYTASSHSVDEYIKRTRNDNITFEEAERELISNLYKGKVVIETDSYRYVKYGVFYYPCGKIELPNKTIYRATTTLTRKMLEEENYFDTALEKYR